MMPSPAGSFRVSVIPLWLASTLLPLWPEASLASLGLWLIWQTLSNRDRRFPWQPVAIATLLCSPAIVRALTRDWSVGQSEMLWLTGVIVSGWLSLSDQQRSQVTLSLGLAPLLSLPTLIWSDSLNPMMLTVTWAATGLWAIAILFNFTDQPQRLSPAWRWPLGIAAAIGLGGSWWLGSFTLRLGWGVGLLIVVLLQRWGITLWRTWTRSPLGRLGVISTGIGLGLLWPFPTAVLAPDPAGLLWRCAQDQIQHNLLRWLVGRGVQSVTTTCSTLTGETADNMSGLLQLWAELGLLGLAAVLTLGFVAGDRYRQLLASSDLPRSQLGGGAALLGFWVVMLLFQTDWLNSGLTPLLLGLSLAIPWTRSLPLRLPTTVDWLLLVALALQVNSAFWAVPLAGSWLVICVIEQLQQRDWRGLGCWATIALIFLPPVFWAKPTLDPSVTWSAYVLLGFGLIGSTGLGHDRSLRLLRWIGLLPLIWLLLNLQAIDWTIRISMGDLYINQVGILTVIATVPALLLTWRDRTWRGLYLLSSLAGGVIILGTASRICLGAFVLAIGMTGVLNWQGRSRRSLIWLLPGFGLLLLGVIALRPDLVGRYLEFYDPARIAIARCYVSQAWMNGPVSFWVGQGYGQAAAICQPPLTLNRVSHAHNFVLQLLADNGILVLAIVLVGLTATVIRLWQQIQQSADADQQLLRQWLLVSLVTGLVLHLFEGSFFKLPLLQLLIGLLLGLPWLGHLMPSRSPQTKGLPTSSSPLA
ncbi:O-antigen ligase family protein [Synechococcus elongatus]|uniref:Uncharacterized protein n=1 Tax=Synechococcus elongatus (strain ATCC 33912 / PCC 7942 / FACHB-805) TaxID=1140 RepID=Q31KU7_SYNE7|nr:hypothetical protein [Synechococcus elongatus]ABB58322.1 conserved hypothetical protein [Synechococcus elongatus PCC 7942 = FACHB-805]AJD57212.1 hypothetical protein M744_04840 [Synechococcus elongatus UTEX 2973]MBD2587045.1 hypothetical protein [Synechococcus elongatus FACHB-242]MBD2688116.1 hypothetical protein [Synechococcus elongatus FACHB-1061]MBD2706173.1 hypothetical protein [Synechococcus elongatus PCC 7942 = FACHB-805]